ncbi:ECF RNA polymerase sigma factor SigL [Streptomyces sp. enrichment culture]|uniref:sigma-70 family RNA polymerase sigma factor n=1 Tax=Streptomyces sp. enrichment culture TaxID=1795815 RepID=UPI003F56DD8C
MTAASVTGQAIEDRPGMRVSRTRAPQHDRQPVRLSADTRDCEHFVRVIYAEHGSALVRFAARLLGGDRPRAEDILQEATIRAWRHIDLLVHQEDGLRPWLFTVVRNLVIDDRRARLVRPVSACAVDDVVISVEDDSERILTRHIVQDAMDDLTPQQREILHHTYFLGHSVAEAAELLDIAQGTVKSRTYYAVRALKLALRNRGVHS